MKRTAQHTSFGGQQEVWKHESNTLGCDMTFGIFLPPQADQAPCPVLYWLSGLTCTEQNFITKAHAQQFAAAHGVVLVAPDTSPRGDDVPDDQAYDLGKGAGFYLSATKAPWKTHYQMHDYIVHELPQLVETSFPVTQARSIFGHSMGGHGALVLALRHPGRYASVSAFSPVVSPSAVPWGQKAFAAYLGEDESSWRQWDACALIADGAKAPALLVDQGTGDEFLESQLQPHRLKEVCEAQGQALTLRMQPGYDHSYYFIATFIGDHIAHHAQALGR